MNFKHNKVHGNVGSFLVKSTMLSPDHIAIDLSLRKHINGMPILNRDEIKLFIDDLQKVYDHINYFIQETRPGYRIIDSRTHIVVLDTQKHEVAEKFCRMLNSGEVILEK